MSVVAVVVIVFMLIGRKGSTYNAVALGITVFIFLALLDILVIRRFIPDRPPQQGLSIINEFRRIFSGDKEYAYSMLFNFVLFMPLGLSLSENLSSRSVSPGRTLKSAVLFAFGFSLCCECLQYVFKVGISELTDVLLNTLGALAGVAVSLLVRGVVRRILSIKTLIF